MLLFAVRFKHNRHSGVRGGHQHDLCPVTLLRRDSPLHGRARRNVCIPRRFVRAQLVGKRDHIGSAHRERASDHHDQRGGDGSKHAIPVLPLLRRNLFSDGATPPRLHVQRHDNFVVQSAQHLNQLPARVQLLRAFRAFIRMRFHLTHLFRGKRAVQIRIQLTHEPLAAHLLFHHWPRTSFLV